MASIPLVAGIELLDGYVGSASTYRAMGEMRLIEVKAFGGADRGDFLWLELNRVDALETDPAAHLYLVTQVRSAGPSAIRILDLTGEQLRKRLEKNREKHNFEVPMPVAVFDDLVANAAALPTLDGAGFLL